MNTSPKTTSASTGWRSILPIHLAAELFPRMAPDELKALGEDIKQNGLTSPIAVVVTKLPRGWSYQLLDGINRLDAMEAVGIQFRIETRDGRCTVDLTDSGIRVDDIRRLMSFAEVVETDPFAFVISTNIHRRHLTAEKKRELIAALIKTKPETSNNAIAKQVKVDDKTVAKVRREMEGRSEIPNVETRTDSKGRQQPSSKPRSSASVHHVVDSKTLVHQTLPTQIGDDKPRDDIGPASAGEIARKDAELEDLRNAKRMLGIKVSELESENEQLRQQATKPVSDEPLTVLIESLRQIISDAQQPVWLKLLNTRKQDQAKKLINRLQADLYELTELRQTAAKAMPDGLDIPGFLDRTKQRAGQ